MYASVLALAALFSSKFNDYPIHHFPKVHHGVDSVIFPELSVPFDFIIVGSGYAGSFLARRLTDGGCKKVRVLVLEAGDMPTFDTALPFTQIYDRRKNEWGYYTVPQRKAAKAMKDRQVRLSMAKALGGDSVTDQGVFMPPNLDDFHRWSYVNNLTGWGFVDMKPYMFDMNKMKDDSEEMGSKLMNMDADKIIRLLRDPVDAHDVFDPLRASWLKAGGDLNFSVVHADDPKMFHDGGFFVPKTMSHTGMKMNAASEFLRDAAVNLFVITNVEVDSLLYTPDGARVVGIEMRDTLTNSTYHANVVKEVLLADGPIRNAQLLMQSGIGPAEHLRTLGIPILQDLPVGVRLNDRVSAHLYIRVRPEFIDRLRGQANDLAGFHKFLTKGSGMLANTSVAGVSLVRTGYLQTPDLLLEMRPVGIVNDRDFAGNINYRDALDDTGKEASNGSLQVTVTVLRPFSQGTMWLWRKRREEVKFTPRINPSYLTDERDLVSLVQGARHVEALLMSPYMAALGARLIYPRYKECGAALLPASQEYWRCIMRYLAGSGNHLTSTTPLGTVVDSRLRVIGMEGLRVVDQSVLPEAATGGVSTTTLVVASRAFRLIKEDHRLRC
uniref:Uncharacterized protein n=1 Tax=Plectus sambesii TaxID=2011161 RepID=A0A914VHI2_9BILA